MRSALPTGLLVATLLAGLVPQTRAVAQPQGLSSVLVELKQEKDAFEEHFENVVQPHLDRVLDSFDANVSRAETLVEQITVAAQRAAADSDDPRLQNELDDLKARYEDALSAAIAQASSYLHEFQQLDDATFAALDNVSESVGQAREAFEQQALEEQQRAEQFSNTAAEVRTRLSEIAEQYSGAVTAGQPLPDEVDLDIRLLQTDLDTSTVNERIARLAATDAQAAANELGRQQGQLRSLHANLQVAFRQGQGQHLLLTNLARVKRQRLEAISIRQRMSSIQDIVAARQANLGRITQLVDSVLRDVQDTDQPSDESTRSVTAQAGAEILRQYLPRKEPQHVQAVR